jgi:aspartate aminotransferase
MNKKGHVSLNMKVRGLGQSATLAINDRVRELRLQGKEIFDLGLGQSPFPVPGSVVEALKLNAEEKNYLPVKGLPELRQAVARFHRRKDHVNVQSDHVMIGPGSKELMFLLQMVFYGEIIVPTPCWVSYVPQATILGKKIRLLHTTYEDNWKVTPEHLNQLFEEEHDVYRPRILVLNYPDNPTGGSYTPEELKEIAEIAKRFEIVLLSDEIYGQLHHRGEHRSVAHYYRKGTIISSGLSKWCGAGGWRLGTFAFPKSMNWLMEAMASVASETYTSVSAPIQYAAIRAFRGGIDIERYLWHARRILSALGNRMAGMLTDAGARVHPPVGAFYLFPDFSPLAEGLARQGIKNSRDLCERLLQDTGVATLPGVVFERQPQELTARLSYVNFEGSKAMAASETVSLNGELPENFLRVHCNNSLKAAGRITDWISKMK